MGARPPCPPTSVPLCSWGTCGGHIQHQARGPSRTVTGTELCAAGLLQGILKEARPETLDQIWSTSGWQGHAREHLYTSEADRDPGTQCHLTAPLGMAQWRSLVGWEGFTVESAWPHHWLGRSRRALQGRNSLTALTGQPDCDISWRFQEGGPVCLLPTSRLIRCGLL